MRPVISAPCCRITFHIFLTIILALTAIPSQSQETSGYNSDSLKVIIGNILIHGNFQTKNSIILRELSFRSGDTLLLSQLRDRMKAGKENIFNTALFNFVTVDTMTFAGNPSKADILIRVIERWYIWPWPYFEISDRNFNTWAETADLSRLTYGIDLTVQNIRGRNETLKIPVHFGFNQKLGFGYLIPYINRKKTIGISAGAAYNRNHEVIVETVQNKTVWYKDPVNFPRQDLNCFAEIRLRPDFYTRHTFRMSYNEWVFADTLLRVQGYAPGISNRLNYFSLLYQFRIDRRDIRFYPLRGLYFDAEMQQNGLGIAPVNEFYIRSDFRHYFRLSPRWYFASGLTVKISFTSQPPYFMQMGLGYGRDYVRGYEYYVIDGRHFTLWKNNFKYAIIPWKIFKIDFLRSEKFNQVPFALFLNIFSDFGYVLYDGESDNHCNDLRNSLLIGYGLGVDMATYYDIVVRLEIAVNLEGTPGLYLHFTAPI